ncbi:type III secretion protein Q [Herbaspirillum sp. Sphag1AN]|uniref:FliM/FliN family flagellar motor switch protein n=1 Tax=unclassified Herbaspirillum TaxID=2624150 RepID=UPI001609E8A7|nr:MULTISPECIES: FliM/FliN family flagellar motor switch protein [unclassified Herbaspirillum]MBB3211528.1 type III secretion protein Q [Herbaspirillum sp. Sphag1AN]MBB3245206.1 type III secretion protein Q [Herbaspirillum sp. Sphag64]
MKYGVLRQLHGTEREARTALALWPLRDASLGKLLSYLPFPETGSIVAISAYRDKVCWRGFLDLDEWVSLSVPNLYTLSGITEMSLPAESNRYSEQVKTLFEASLNPIEIPIPELFYEVIQIRSEVELPPKGSHLLSVATPQGRVWLEDFPRIETPMLPVSGNFSKSMEALPINIEWRLGYSLLNRAPLTQVRRGDVMLISRETFDIGSGDTVIGKFSIDENGEVFVQVINPEDKMKRQDMNEFVEKSHTASSAVETSSEEALEVGTAIADIPLRVDFILQRSVMTVAQMDALYRGQIFTFDQDAEAQVELVVNGRRIGQGELVELNGRLGVELHEILVGRYSKEK